MTKKLLSQDPVKPEPEDDLENGARSRTSPEIVGRLSKTLASDKSQRYVADAMKLVEEHEKQSSESPLPDGNIIMVGDAVDAEDVENVEDPVPSRDSVTDKEEVDEAAATLTSAVDQMVPAIHLSLGMLLAAIRWMKFVAALILITIVLLIVLVENGIRTANSNKRAADSINTSRLELVEVKGELIDIEKSMMGVLKADARREIAAAAEPKLVAGDKPGEVTLVTPDIDPEDIERAKKKAEEAVEKGEKPPKLPLPNGKISVMLGKKEKSIPPPVRPWPPEQVRAPPPNAPPLPPTPEN